MLRLYKNASYNNELTVLNNTLQNQGVGTELTAMIINVFKSIIKNVPMSKRQAFYQTLSALGSRYKEVNQDSVKALNTVKEQFSNSGPSYGA